MWRGVVVAASGVLLLTLTPARAHEERQVGPLEVEVGWLEEPAFAGFANAVQLTAVRGNRPVRGADLEVQVLFGDPDSTESTEPLPLLPAFGSPGEYHAFLIPTRPGTYTFLITGALAGRDFDEEFTSGETFDDVQNPADAQFPARDPTAGELATRLDRIDSRIQALRQDIQAQDLGSGAGASTVLAIVAVVLAALAVVLAGAGLAGRRAS
ncbi:MAG: hypothetical protein ACRDI0_06435 [Actinomycetota bacterium]